MDGSRPREWAMERKRKKKKEKKKVAKTVVNVTIDNSPVGTLKFLYGVLFLSCNLFCIL